MVPAGGSWKGRAAQEGLGDNLRNLRPPSTLRKKAAAPLTSAEPPEGRTDCSFPTQLPTQSKREETETCGLLVLKLKKKKMSQIRAGEGRGGREQPARGPRGAGQRGQCVGCQGSPTCPLQTASTAFEEEKKWFLASWPLQA